MKKVQDEYTNRSDLTHYQKWYRRNTAKAKASVKRWRMKNLEKARADQADYMRRVGNPRARAKKLEKINSIAKIEITRKRPKFAFLAKRKEIERLLQRGKNVVDIAMWLHCPVSAVTAVQNGCMPLGPGEKPRAESSSR